MNQLPTKMLGAALALALAGCAGAEVSNAVHNVPITNARPQQIVVYPFAVSPDEVTLNQGFFARTYSSLSGENQDQKQADIAHETAQNVCLEVVTALTQQGYPAICQNRGLPVQSNNTLIVDGEFTDISEGNRLRRMVIGFGMGASVLDTDVYVYQHANGTSQQVLTFNTHADSGKMPGVAVTGAPGAAAGGAAAAASLGVNAVSSGVKTYRSSTGYLADDTSKKIVEQLHQYFTQQGWGS